MRRIVQLQEGTAGASYSFACTDPAGQLSSSEVTTFVTLVLKDKLGHLQNKKDSGQLYVPPPKPKRGRGSPRKNTYITRLKVGSRILCCRHLCIHLDGTSLGVECAPLVCRPTKATLRRRPPTTPLAARPPTTFEELLEPLGLTDKYCAAFEASRIPFQVLVHTRLGNHVTCSTLHKWGFG